jgi:hypothetical protein
VKNNIFEKLVLFILKKLDLLSLYSLKRIGPLIEDGWFRSYKEDTCVDAEGNPLPWMTYPAIEFLKKRVQKDMIIFEYGCGESTLWWASKVKEVVSVEHDKDWFGKISYRIPANVNLFCIKLEYGGSYSRKIMEYRDKFDVVVIDGRDRVHCVMNSLEALKSDGIIIWDNSDRGEYEDGYRFLFRNGFKKIAFVGLTPVVNVKSETGIFYREKNCLFI